MKKLTFKPDPAMKSIYQIYLLLVIVIGILSWAAPLCIFVSQAIPYIAIPTSIATLFAYLWISKYYQTVTYVIDDEMVYVEKGVWWKRKNFVPFSRIVNIDMVQGPISRRFGVASLFIQTAGYSYGYYHGMKSAEAVISYIKDYERIKDLIFKKVLKFKEATIEAEEEMHINSLKEIVEEVKKIRKILEEKHSI
jgi:hypothetical protein